MPSTTFALGGGGLCNVPFPQFVAHFRRKGPVDLEGQDLL